MTPECPKGPERGARPEEVSSFKERIESAIVWARHDYDHNENLIISREAAANAAWSEVQPELERLSGLVQNFRFLWNNAVKRADNLSGTVARLQEELREVSRLREQLAAQPHVPVDASDHVFAALERVAGVHTGSQLGDQTDAVMGLLRSWGVSSSEVEAPRPQEMVQHRVNIAVAQWDARVSFAACSDCPEKCCGDTPDVEHWKDQHEADTLRPTLTNESFISPQQAMDELSRQSQEFYEDDEPVEEIVAAFENGLKFATAPPTSASPVQIVSEGRPSGSGAAAPQAVETFDCKQDCPAVAPECFCVGTEPHRLCCHANAAQAARSEATPRVWAEVDLQPCPEDVRQVLDCNNFVWRRLVNDQWITGHQGDGPCGWPYLIKKFGPLSEVSCTEQEAEK